MRQLTSPLAMVRFGRTMAEHSGLSDVKFHDEWQFFTSINTSGTQRIIHVPKPNAMWTDKEWTHWFYGFFHEIGHWLPTTRDWVEVSRKYKLGGESFLGTLVNQLEDYRQERLQLGEYSGRDYYLKLGRSYHQSVKPMPDGPVHQNAGYATWILDMQCREVENEYLEGFAARQLEQAGDGVVELFKKIEHVTLDDMETAEDSYEKALELIRLLGLDEEAEKQQAERAYEKAKDGEKGEEGDGDGSAGERGSGDGESGDEEGERTAGTIAYKDLQYSTHEKDESTTGGLRITDYDPTQLGFIPASTPYKVVDHTTKDHHSNYYYKAVMETHTGESFAGSCRRILQDESRTRYEFGKKRGKVHGKNLYRARIR